jgi:hypothetical protein
MLPSKRRHLQHRQERRAVQKFENIPVVLALAGYHVTDDPQKIITTLQTGQPLDRGEEGRQHDLQTGGFYFSEAPQLWSGRSTAIWDFAKTVTSQQREALAQAVLTDERITGDWYLTESEQDRARRYIQQYSESGNVVYLHFLAEQPFNMQTWQPSFLEKIGIPAAKPLQYIEVVAEGTFADLSNVQVTRQLLSDLKAAGYDGACVTSTMAYVPQSVVWNNRAIVQCGTYQRSPAGQEQSQERPKNT